MIRTGGSARQEWVLSILPLGPPMPVAGSPPHRWLQQEKSRLSVPGREYCSNHSSRFAGSFLDVERKGKGSVRKY